MKRNVNINRFDIFENTKHFLVEDFVKTKEGYLKGRAVVTNIGIFRYKTQDNEIINELRSPENVMQEDSINTLKGIPVTNNHPKSEVNTENIKKLQIGYTGDDIRTDQIAISIPITITDKKSIEEIENGDKIALSCGYSVDLDFSENGYAFGNNRYDAVQKNIRYNHIAIVPAGRAGDLAKIKLRADSNDAILNYSDNDLDNNKINNIDNKKNMEEKMNNPILKKISIDSVEYEAEKEVINAYSALKKDKESMILELEKNKNDISKIQADHDTLKDKLDEAEKIIKELENKKIDDADIQKKVDERIAIIEKAIRAGLEIKKDMANLDIKKSIIKKVFPNADLNEKDEIYVNGRYDSAIEYLEEKKAADNKKPFFQPTQKNNDNTDMSYTEKYINNLENAWKDYIPGKN